MSVDLGQVVHIENDLQLHSANVEFPFIHIPGGIGVNVSPWLLEQSLLHLGFVISGWDGTSGTDRHGLQSSVDLGLILDLLHNGLSKTLKLSEF